MDTQDNAELERAAIRRTTAELLSAVNASMETRARHLE